MTLTTPRVTASCDIGPVGGTTRPRLVHAVLLTARGRQDPAALVALLDAVHIQTRLVDEVLVVDRSGADAPEASPFREVLRAHRLADQTRIVHEVVPDVRNSRAAVSVALDRADSLAPDGGADLLWFLEPGSRPEATCLATLLAAWSRSPSTAIVGPKLLGSAASGAEEPGGPEHATLVGLGIRATRAGRLPLDTALGSADQGQHDHRLDVLAVPLTGSLIAAETLAGLRPWEPTFGDLGADLDLCWRVHAAGQRVALAPSATVAVNAPPTAGAGARRAARRVALTRAPLWATPFLGLWILLSALLGGLGLLLLKRPRAAWAEFADITALDPTRGLLARVRTRGRRRVRRRDLRSLFVPASAVLAQGRDQFHDALFGTAAAPPKDVVVARRPWLTRTLTNPGLLAFTVTLVTVGVAGRTLGLPFLRHLPDGVTGGALQPGRADSGGLWAAYADGWAGSGLGGPGSGRPDLAIHAALAQVVQWLHLPGASGLTGSAETGLVAAVLVLALPLASVSAHLAARLVTGRRWLRAGLGIAWACTAASGAALAQGRLGVLLALVLLPAVAAGLALLGRPDGTATSTFATALATAILAALVPVLGGFALLVALLLVVLGPGLGVRVRALLVLVLAPALLGPWLGSVVADWRLLLATPGALDLGGAAPPSWHLHLAYAAAPLAVLGLLGLALGTSWRAPQTVLAVVLVASLAAAVVAPRVGLGAVAGTPGVAGAPIHPWQPMLLLPAALALLASAGLLLDRAVAFPRILVRGALSTVAVFGVAALAGAFGWAGLGATLQPQSDPRPLWALDQASGGEAARTVLVEMTGTDAAYAILARETDGPLRGIPTTAPTGDALERALAGVLDGTTADPAAPLADLGVDLLAVRGVAPEVARRLDTTAGLGRLADAEGAALWRVTRGALAEAPSRARIETANGSVLVPVTGEHAATRMLRPPAGRLVVAETPGWAARALVTADGVALPVTTGTVQTYVVPAGTEMLAIDVPPMHPWWLRGQLFGLGLVCFLALPFGRRESRMPVRSTAIGRMP